jgi:hypothetical protein
VIHLEQNYSGEMRAPWEKNGATNVFFLPESCEKMDIRPKYPRQQPGNKTLLRTLTMGLPN